MEYVVSFLIFLLVVIAMAVGVIFGKNRIKGSCGGLANIGIEKSCDCDSPCDEHQILYKIEEPEK